MIEALRSTSLAQELRAFWPIYLWHHRRPWTRRLHFVGSCACIAGALFALVWWPALPIGIGVGYLFAFTGHWVVEKNRPLTFGRPILAGICNWIMFALELTGGLEAHMQAAEEQARDDHDGWDDVGSC